VNHLKEAIIDLFLRILQVNVKSPLNKPIPTDGTVHSVTSFVMTCLG
jgi:hypothetical protein